ARPRLGGRRDRVRRARHRRADRRERRRRPHRPLRRRLLEAPRGGLPAARHRRGDDGLLRRRELGHAARAVRTLLVVGEPGALRPRRPRMSYDPSSLEGVPEHGRERLARMKRGLFTSDLSVNEFLLVKQAGFDPLGLVVGSSIYHIGYQQSSWRKSMEMDVLSQAMYEARELGMTRMEEEAGAL